MKQKPRRKTRKKLSTKLKIFKSIFKVRQIYLAPFLFILFFLVKNEKTFNMYGEGNKKEEGGKEHVYKNHFTNSQVLEYNR